MGSSLHRSIMGNEVLMGSSFTNGHDWVTVLFFRLTCSTVISVRRYLCPTERLLIDSECKYVRYNLIYVYVCFWTMDLYTHAAIKQWPYMFILHLRFCRVDKRCFDISEVLSGFSQLSALNRIFFNGGNNFPFYKTSRNVCVWFAALRCTVHGETNTLHYCCLNVNFRYECLDISRLVS